jgi:GMP synthase-like glutamine amidotransferase
VSGRRVLHLVNLEGGPAELFLPPLRDRGLTLEDVNPNVEPLPESLAGYDAVLATGGTANTHETDRYPWLDPQVALLQEALHRNIPVFGLCLGAQLLTKAAGGSVHEASEPEVGWRMVDAVPEAGADPVLAAMPPRFAAFQWHHYACEPPAGTPVLAANAVCVQAFRLGEVAWATQFHIEVTREILLDWQRMGPEELASHGYDEARFVEEMDRHLPAHEAIGRDMAVRFAAIVDARAAAVA